MRVARDAPVGRSRGARWIRTAQAARSRGARWLHDQRGNMQIVEVMIVGLLVVSAVVAVSTMNVPVTETEGFKQDNERLAKDSLNALASRPSSSPLFGSTLEEYVMEAIAGDPSLLMDYLNKTLPGGAAYNVYLDNNYGPPRAIVEQGQAPREAVAGSIQMVPKLAYTFTVPEFEHYHGDFHMNMYAVPIHSGVLLHDEGDTVEVAVTFQEVNDVGKLTGDPVMMKTYTHTALRNNDPAGRSWPSVSMTYLNETSLEEEYRVYRNVMVVYGDKIDNDPPSNLAGDAYRIEWTMRLTETADVKVPKNTILTMDFPRGYDFNETKQQYLADQNADRWKDWNFTGSVNTGWTITTKTKETFKNEAIDLLVSSNFRTVFDTAYPFYTPVTFSLGEGVLGQTHIIVDVPQQIVVGAFGREAYVSVTKPLISGDVTKWGIGFGNNGDRVRIQKIVLSQPEGKELLADVEHRNGWVEGTWLPVAGKPGAFEWEPDSHSIVASMEQMWLTLDVTAGSVVDNNFRNQDYYRVHSSFNPMNGTGLPNTLGHWNYTERLYRMGEEWVYRDAIPPYDDIPGWGDQEGRRYWTTGGTFGLNKALISNTSYSVLPTGIGANAFGGYQGAHVASQIDIVDQKDQPVRDFALGDRVHISNNFSALFSELSRLDSDGSTSVNDLKIRSKVHTPELGWKGIPSLTFSADASLGTQLDPIERLLSRDLNADGIADIIAIGSDNLVYGLDGRDGVKFWTITLASDVTSATLSDLDGDGHPELFIGMANGRLGVYDTDPSTTLSNRELWVKNLVPLDPFGLGDYIVTDIVKTGHSGSGVADTAVAVSAVTGEALVVGLETTKGSATKVVEYNASALTNAGEAFIYDLEKVMWAESGPPVAHVAFSSGKKIVTMLTLPDLKPVWTERLPQTVDRLYAADLDGDGHDDLVADTLPTDSLAADGNKVFTLTGGSGDFAPTIRTTNPAGLGPALDAGTSFKSLVAVDGTDKVFVTAEADFDPRPHTVQFSKLSPGDDGFHGVHVAKNGTVFIISNGGTILHNTTVAVFETWEWNEITEEILPSIMRDLHVSPTFGEGGPLYAIDNKGGIMVSTTGDSWSYTKLAQPCTHASIPDAGLTCGLGFEMRDLHILEDADGEATEFWVLVEEAGTTWLVKYDVASAKWSTEGTWSMDGRTFDITSNGGIWVAGDDSSRPVLYERFGGTWRTHTLWRNATGDEVRAVLIQDNGDAWAASKNGEVWKRIDDRMWIPFYVDGYTNDGNVQLTETSDGEPWLIGKDYQHAPLRLFDHTSYADFLVEGLETTGGALRIDSIEGHLGGRSSVPGRQAVTQIDWLVRPEGATGWIPLTKASVHGEPGIYNSTHTTTLVCLNAKKCSSLELRAVLNNTQSPGTDPPYTMGGVTPLLRSFYVNFSVDPSNFKETVVKVDEDTLRPSSTAVYSKFRDGAIQAQARTPWTFYGEEESQVPGAQERLVVVSDDDLSTGDPFAQVVVVNEHAGQLERWTVNGTTGLSVGPGDLTTFGFAPTDVVQQILLAPLIGSDLDDVVMAGKFQATAGSLMTWDVAGGTDLVTPGKDMTAVTAIVDTGVDAGLRTVAYGGANGDLRSMSGSISGTKVTLRWTSVPSVAQGLATFVYQIPLDAMYGTAVVVSELSFEIETNGIPVTQTARLVDWFDMRPPDREVPRPPIYTIQIVSWFNEA